MKHIVIPARFASTRLSGKPLLKIHGREMILRVVDQAKKVEGFDDLCVATDDQRIYDLCMAEGVDVVLTSADHPSGTDRLSEVAKIKGWASEDIIVIAGGVIPAQDYDFLYKAGVAAIFGPGSPVAKAACTIMEILVGIILLTCR